MAEPFACLNCDHEWSAVFPSDYYAWHCPKCHEYWKGIFARYDKLPSLELIAKDIGRSVDEVEIAYEEFRD